METASLGTIATANVVAPKITERRKKGSVRKSKELAHKRKDQNMTPTRRS